MKNQIQNAPDGAFCKSTVVESCTCIPDDHVELGIFLELGSIGAGHAATSLSEILQQKILIDIPKIHRLPPQEIPQVYQRHDSPTTGVYMQLADSECDILLLIEVAEAKKIAAIMTMAPSIEELDPVMEASAIEELANILIGSFLTAISDFTGVSLVPTTPQRIVDTFDAIIDYFLVKRALMDEEVLIFDTHFKRQAAEGQSLFVLFPSPQLQNMLVQKSKELART